MIPGRATAQGTKAYAARMAGATAPGHFRALGDLALSSIGAGTYLGTEDDATDAAYAAAMEKALTLGTNVLDTAVNYRCQRSERVIGRVLRRAIASGTLLREEVVLATKGGFVPFDGSRPRDMRAYMQETFIGPGILPLGELVGGCHCLAPGYLADQIERSRHNLDVETIDVYYLHNPEMQLEEVGRETFLARMRAAFEMLEAAVAEGKIAMYGTATWDGYRKPGQLSLAELVALAKEVGGASHRFRVLQLPLNLAMTEALRDETQGDRTLLSAADAEGVYVMTSASILQGRLSKNLPAELREVLGLETDAQRSLQFVRSTPGVGTALVGMKTTAHVDENLAVARVPPLPPQTVATLFA